MVRIENVFNNISSTHSQLRMGTRRQTQKRRCQKLNAQMPYAQMCKCTNAQMPNAQMRKCANSQLDANLQDTFSRCQDDEERRRLRFRRRRQSMHNLMSSFVEAVGAKRSLYGVKLQSYMDVFSAMHKNEVQKCNEKSQKIPVKLVE